MKNHLMKAVAAIVMVVPTLTVSAAGLYVGSNVNVAVPALIQASSSAGASVGASVNVPVTTSANVNVDSGQSASTSDSTAVNSSIQAVISSDSNVSKVETSDSNVSVWYKEKAKFLGFIPVMVATDASVDASGNAQISHPWYDFLTVTDDSAAQTQLQSQVSGHASANGTLSDSAKISLIGIIHNSVQAWLSSNASANTSASTNASASY